MIFSKVNPKYVLTVIDFIWLREVREGMRQRLVAADEKRLCTHAAPVCRGAADLDRGQTIPKAFWLCSQIKLKQLQSAANEKKEVLHRVRFR